MGNARVLLAWPRFQRAQPQIFWEDTISRAVPLYLLQPPVPWRVSSTSMVSPAGMMVATPVEPTSASAPVERQRDFGRELAFRCYSPFLHPPSFGTSNEEAARTKELLSNGCRSCFQCHIQCSQQAPESIAFSSGSVLP